MGTFHAKFMVIDRRIACVSSNNIQDRVNLELNIHLEGPIVESFYDMALLSWSEKMEPPLPLLVNPKERIVGGGADAFERAKERKSKPSIYHKYSDTDRTLQRLSTTLRTRPFQPTPIRILQMLRSL